MLHRRSLVAAVVVAAVLLGLPATAWAHVVIEPKDAPAGGAAELVLRVPNERDDASTVRIDMRVPTDRPIANVFAPPKEGWTIRTRTERLPAPITVDGRQVTEVVSEISWSGGAIPPGQRDSFEVAMGPLPTGVDRLELRTIQTYSNGEEVAWIEPTPPGGAEPERPSPVLLLTGGTAAPPPPLPPAPQPPTGPGAPPSGPGSPPATVAPPAPGAPPVTTAGPPSPPSPPGPDTSAEATTAPSTTASTSSSPSERPGDEDLSLDDAANRSEDGDDGGGGSGPAVAAIVVALALAAGGAVLLNRRRSSKST